MKRRRRTSSDDFDLNPTPSPTKRSMSSTRLRSGSTRGNQERPKLIDMLGSDSKQFGTALGLLEGDSPPDMGKAAYQKVRVSKLMDEDCISMRNDPIDPLETVDDM